MTGVQQIGEKLKSVWLEFCFRKHTERPPFGRKSANSNWVYRHYNKETEMQKLKELMSTDVQVIGPDDTIEEAAQKMQSGDFGMLPVEENDRMIGSISDRDITIRGVAAGKASSTKVREVMSEGIIWAFEDDSVADAAKLMSEHQIRRLPVVNSAKRLVGIVALGDFAVENADMKVAGEALSEISQPA